MVSQSYDVNPDKQSMTQLPVVDWCVPMYINEDVTLLPVPMPTPYPYTFDHITAGREELLNLCFEQHMFIKESKKVVQERFRKYYYHESSSSSGFTTDGTPNSNCSPQFQEEHTLYDAYGQHGGVAVTQLGDPQPSSTIMYNCELCYLPVQQVKTPMQVYIKETWILVWALS
ncbi:hypothetical protein MKW92_002104 [Papaver armeniacum]|nr:hypothetical protein MKW92_002104 [Papaver armeniacum]